MDVGSRSCSTIAWRCGIVRSLTRNGLVQPVSLPEPLVPLPGAQRPASTSTKTRPRPRMRRAAIAGICHTPASACTPFRAALGSRRGARSEANRRRAEGASRAHRGRERRAARRLDGHVGAGSGVAPRPRREHRRRSSRSTRPGTSGSRSAASPSARCSSAATSTRCRTAAGSTAASTSSPASRCCAAWPRRGRRRSRCGSSTGPTRRARASAAACSARARRPARWPTRTSCAS